MTFNCVLVKIKLIFVWSTAYASFVQNLICWSWSCSFFWRFLQVLFSTSSLFIHFLSWVSKLVEFSILNVHWLRLRATLWLIWRYHLCVISSSLWSSLNLILNLSLLFFIRVSYLNTLTDLLMLRSIQWSHLLRIMNYHIFNRRFMLNIILVNIRILLSFLTWILSVSSLSCQSSRLLSLTNLIWIICSI